MFLLPYENLIYETNLSENELIERLCLLIEPKQIFRFVFGMRNSISYEGNISYNRFEISRIIRYKNSFLPQISGEIEESNSSTLIKVKMRMSTFGYIFMSSWCGGLLMLTTSALSSVKKTQEFGSESFIPLFMGFLGLLINIGAFKFESWKSKKDLEIILSAKRIK